MVMVSEWLGIKSLEKTVGSHSISLRSHNNIQKSKKKEEVAVERHDYLGPEETWY